MERSFINLPSKDVPWVCPQYRGLVVREQDETENELPEAHLFRSLQSALLKPGESDVATETQLVQYCMS